MQTFGEGSVVDLVVFSLDLKTFQTILMTFCLFTEALIKKRIFHTKGNQTSSFSQTCKKNVSSFYSHHQLYTLFITFRSFQTSIPFPSYKISLNKIQYHALVYILYLLPNMAFPCVLISMISF